MAKRKVKLNIYGNWKGYEGRNLVQDFGPDEVMAGHWLLTGEYSSINGWDHPEECKQAVKGK